MAGDPYKVKKNRVLAKGANTTRIIGLDAATGITGYSIYDDGELISYGTYKTDNNKNSEEADLVNLFAIFISERHHSSKAIIASSHSASA